MMVRKFHKISQLLSDQEDNDYTESGPDSPNDMKITSPKRRYDKS